MIAEMLEQLHDPVPVPEVFAEYVSLKCANCAERLEFSFSESQDEAKELDNAMFDKGWVYGRDGIECGNHTDDTPVRVESPAYSKPWIIRG